MSVNVRYVVFKSRAMVREYTFLVQESSAEPHETIFTILNETFTSRRLSFQNAPDICSLKLYRELSDSTNNPLRKHYRISENELDAYHESHSPKAAKGLYPRKPARASNLDGVYPITIYSGGHQQSRVLG